MKRAYGDIFLAMNSPRSLLWHARRLWLLHALDGGALALVLFPVGCLARHTAVVYTLASRSNAHLAPGRQIALMHAASRTHPHNMLTVYYKHHIHA